MQPHHAEDHLSFLDELRNRFDTQDTRWTLSVTLTASKIWLDQFPLKGMKHHVNWFNLKTGDSDESKDGQQPLLRGHMDMSEIKQSIHLLQDNDVDLNNVALGMLLYGHAFILDNHSCIHPDGTCKYSATRKSSCSAQPGMLSYAELLSRNESQEAQVYHSSSKLFKYTVFEDDTWAAFDDATTWAAKKALMHSLGMGGLGLWWLNHDNGRFEAMSELLGDFSSLQLKGGSATPQERKSLAEPMAAFTGQDCFATAQCTDGSLGQRGAEQTHLLSSERHAQEL
ncbi:hypothetical protein CDD81_3489 [Ophiocordyceps australis]|uniref:chitinase n=1 Tax=Ophiocordyceps australis TaxID=1399860 RepID=A0A2C5YDZ0_9HYPO|nr:hypothetical protein CDD81_3489 [Ophiocordyceps australis]